MKKNHEMHCCSKLLLSTRRRTAKTAEKIIQTALVINQ